MAQEILIFGSDNSPYSRKVKAYAEYKGLPYQWLLKAHNEEEFGKIARLPLVPAVKFPDGTAMQDSTPIMEQFDVKYPEPTTHPVDPSLRFLSLLLEEFGDEWGNKLMFHYRWRRPIDQDAVAMRLAREMVAADADEETVTGVQKMIKVRMCGRGFTVGSNDQTAPIIEESFKDTLRLLESHLAKRPYLLGDKPCFGDFGLAHQFFQAYIDPTAGAVMKATAPTVCGWCERMLAPANLGQGHFESLETLLQTLEPLLRGPVLQFLQWSDANSKAMQLKAKTMRVEMAGGAVWEQTLAGPQKYQVKSLAALRSKFQRVSGVKPLCDLLDRCGCLVYLAGGTSKL